MDDIVQWMTRLAPLQLSEQWDNTGLLLGDPGRLVSRVMTCLTLSEDCVAEAVDRNADLIVAHHPLPFRPLSRITAEDETGRRVWQLAVHGISVYSPHTAWDSAARGINAQLAELLGCVGIRPLIPRPEPEWEAVGTGRVGQTSPALSWQELVQRVKSTLPSARVRGVPTHRPISSVAVACGSGGSLLDAAIDVDADVLVTGEATYHTCLQARSAGVGLLMLGHYASERFAMESLAVQLQTEFPALAVWPAACESDPVQDC
ncbi:MAG: Nif3-like dinuclear metal center hexameric protein [Planctomycetota bacterium]|nr:MAG: Nif3-like dinuclear metal center hexameric protein [Planctomycetota bacterium]